MQTFKRYAMSSLVVLIVICACGKAENHITEAADSILPRQTEEAKEAKELVAQPVEVKDISLNNGVILKVAVGSKGCCIRKITAKKSCKKLVIPENIEGAPVTSIEHTSNSTAAPDDDEDDDGLSINIFGVMNNNSDCDEAASTEELIHANNTNIQEIVLPDSVKTIAKSSFQGLTGLKKIHLPKQLKEIEDYTFARCSKLKRIDVPQNVSKIDIGAFWLCKSFKRLHIKSGNHFFLEKGDVILNKSDYSMFMFSKKKKNAVIPKEARTVGRNAFNFFEPKTIKISKKNKYIKQKQNCIYEKKSKTLIAVKSDKNNVVNIPKGYNGLIN
ncbi:MAG: leucine-rich repeat domain-containing protein [Eubacterium sp.]|nr:leucine-rich repeat domain-containing protein [Eubacterium sp.]